MLHTDIQTALQSGGERTGDSRSGRRIRSVLVIAEFAFSVILLSGATLLVRSFINLRSVDPGFDVSHTLTLQMALTGPRYQTSSQISAFVRKGIERLSAFPGVDAVAATNYLPLAGGINIPLSRIEGRSKP